MNQYQYEQGEVESEVKTYLIERKCSYCQGAMMRATGNNDGQNFPYRQFEHKCEQCNTTNYFKKCYPITGYKKVVAL